MLRAAAFGLPKWSADHHELPVPVPGGSLHDSLRSPVVDPRCLGGSVDRCAVTACSQHCDHSLDGLCSHAGCNQLRRKFCIYLCCLGLRWALHRLCRVGLQRCRGLYPLGLCRLCPPTGRRKPCGLGLCTLPWRLRQPLHHWSLCIGGRGPGANSPCWFVPECNQHQRADGHRRVDYGGEDTCNFRAVSNRLHQIAQRQKADNERTYTDGRNSTDGPAVNPAGCSRTDGEGDAVHGGEEGVGGKQPRCCPRRGARQLRRPGADTEWRG